MIWFTCSQCHKTHGRPEGNAGALIFCECGHGNLVPWESSAAEPRIPTAELPAAPELAPLTFEPEVEEAAPLRGERPRRGQKRDPERCFNHQNVAKAAVCADCDEAFCADCLVKLQEVPLCGPCKNFRARRLELPPLNSSFASASLILAFLAGPFALVQLWWNGSPGMRLLSILALLPQFLALGLGAWALYRANQEGEAASPSFAITGIATAATICLLTALLHVAAVRGMF
jgi:hypothetical protein